MVHINTILHDLVGWINRQDRFVQFSLAALILLLVGYVDAVTGSAISVSILYVLPVMLVAYTLGPRWGLLFGLAAAVIERFVFGPQEFASLVRIWNTLVRLGTFGIIVWLITQLKQTLNAERAAAREDFLTGLLNRRAFEERAEVELERCRRNGTPTAILYVDCDDFKQVNDEHGHRQGDRVLQTIAETMKSSLRSTDVLARLGGDEFAAMLPDSGESQARAVAEKLHTALVDALNHNGPEITCSLGVAVFAAVPDNLEAMIHHADELMYRVKQTGKGAAQIDVFFGH